YHPPRIRQVKAAGASHKDSLSREEVRSLIEAAQSIELNGQSIAPLLLFLVLTGMRRMEAVTAEWSWIDETFIRVPAPRTKTNQKRLVPISKDLAKLLASLPRTSSGQLFPAMTIEITRKFQDACKAAGITRPLKLHNLRDTFIVNAIMSGIPVLLVARIVGNSPSVIDKHYAPLAEDEMKSALKKLDATGFATNLLPAVSRETITIS
ncbi:site-specific integrase, partial [bacterium]|nr:site-specific integrase [bacterium]